jgi:hypothetical protein
MRIEQKPYVAEILPERVPNRHELIRLRYTILKDGPRSTHCWWQGSPPTGRKRANACACT